jgi:hypothetical protein
MKKAALIACLALLPGLAFAQAPVTKVVRVHYAKAQSIANLVPGGSHIGVSADNTLQVIVLSGEPAVVASVEQMIRELDVPSNVQVSKDIEVIVSVIGASSGPDLPAGQEMPEGMTPVIKQLRGIFPYKNYQLLSSMLLRSREGANAENKGNMKGFENTGSKPMPGEYSIEYGEASVSSEQGKPVIHLRKFQFFTSVANSNQMFGVRVSTDIDLPEGQKTVVGKANVESIDSALFVVLTARLVN